LKRPSEIKPAKGKVLISEPFLPDLNFSRSVILLAEHSETATLGFVLNQSTDLFLHDLFEDIDVQKVRIFKGGPVQLNSLHFIHCDETLREDAQEIMPGLYWGGDFELLKDRMTTGVFNPELYKFFMGYSGWSPGQLEHEIEEDSWLISGITLADALSQTNSGNDLWKKTMTALGGEYALLANSPLNPLWN
jgi:putative transcriptional regulator